MVRLSRTKPLLPAPKDASQRYLVVTPGELHIDKDDNWKGGNTVTVTVWLQKGNDAPTQNNLGLFQVQVFKDGAGTPELIRTDSTFTFTASKTATFYEVRLIIDDAMADSKTIRIMLDGSDGDNSVVFLLKPSKTSINFVKDSTGKALTPNSISISCSYTRYEGESAEVYDGTDVNNLYGIDEKYEMYYRWVNNYSLGNWEHLKNETNGTLTVGKDDAVTAVEFAMSTETAKSRVADSNIITKITVPITREGLDGEDGSNGIDGSDGSDGSDGEDGKGIVSMTDYYLATTMATGVTRHTDINNWSSNYQIATEDKPYVWKYTDTLWTDGTHTYTVCELVFSYSAGGNPNLLEQTNFSSLQALGKWQRRGAFSWRQGVTPVSEDRAEIVTGLRAHNAYHESTLKTASQIAYKEIMEQVLWNSAGTIRKIEPSTWYTLSFWYKGDGCRVYIYPSCLNGNVTGYLNGVATALSGGGGIDIEASSTWVRWTITFKTLSSFSSSDQCVLWRILGIGSDESISTKHSYICMPKLEVGMQATGYLSNESSTHFGQPRKRRWALNTEYMAGGVDEQYDDTVLVETSGFYHCIKTHISSLQTKPGTGASWQQYWETGSKVDILATDIFFAEKAYIANLIAMMIQTGYEGTPHVEAQGSVFKIFGYGQYPAIELSMEEWPTASGGDGEMHAVLRFRNEYTGEVLYDLGPTQINSNVSQQPNEYEKWMLKSVSSGTATTLVTIMDSGCSAYYRFTEGYTQTGNVRTYRVSGQSTPSASNACFFTSQSYLGTKIPDGWYEKANNGHFMQEPTDDGTTAYSVIRYRFNGGKLVETKFNIIQWQQIERD